MIEFNFTLIMTWINFLILFVVLRKFLFLPILEIQEKRKKHMEGSKNLVSESMKQVEALEKQYQERMIQARAVAQDLMNQARHESLADKKQKRSEAEALVEKKIEAARVMADQQIQSARDTLPMRSSLLAAQIMTKILGRPVEVALQDSMDIPSLPVKGAH